MKGRGPGQRVVLLNPLEQPGWGHSKAMRKGDQREQPWLSASPFEQRDLGAVQAAREAQGFLGQALAFTLSTKVAREDLDGARHAAETRPAQTEGLPTTRFTADSLDFRAATSRGGAMTRRLMIVVFATALFAAGCGGGDNGGDSGESAAVKDPETILTCTQLAAQSGPARNSNDSVVMLSRRDLGSLDPDKGSSSRYQPKGAKVSAWSASQDAIREGQYEEDDDVFTYPRGADPDTDGTGAVSLFLYPSVDAAQKAYRTKYRITLDKGTLNPRAGPEWPAPSKEDDDVMNQSVVYKNAIVFYGDSGMVGGGINDRGTPAKPFKKPYGAFYKLIRGCVDHPEKYSR